MKFLKKLFTSKKWLAALSGILVVTANAGFDLNLDPEVLLGVLSMLGAFILGQGWADSGKEAALLLNPDKPNLPAVDPK